MGGRFLPPPAHGIESMEREGGRGRGGRGEGGFFEARFDGKWRAWCYRLHRPLSK